MLQLLNICKSYTTADFTQTALDKVSVAFRDNEFVAVLGQSGSGKTTLLNVVGGLDRLRLGRPRHRRHLDEGLQGTATGTPTATTASASSSRPTT